MAPPDKRTGPRVTTPQGRIYVEVLTTDTATVTVPRDVPGGVPAGLRRRREAVSRLPPLASGYRDPIDALAGLPIARHADVCRGMFSGNGRWVPCCGRGAA